jgi:hypothetical protein
MKKLLLIASLFYVFTSNAQFTSNNYLNTPVCNYAGKQGDPRIIEDGKGGSYIAWKDWRNNGIPDIFLQRMDSQGRPMWMLNGLNLCTDPADQSTPNLTLDEQGGVIVAWSDLRSGIERDLYAQRVDSNGFIKWGFNGAVVTDKTAREHNEKIAPDENSGAYICWEEQSGPGWDVWIQHMDSAGNRLWGNGGIRVCTSAAYRLNPKIQADKRHGVFITWQQQNSTGEYDIRAQRMDTLGTLIWGNDGLQVTNVVDEQINPKIDPDPSIGGCYISWIDKRNGVDYDIYAQRIDSTGATLWGVNGKPVINAVANQSAQDIASNNNINGLVVAWKDERNGANNFDIFVQKLDKNGNQKWGAGGKAITTALFDQINPTIAGDKANGVLIAWEDKGLFADANIRGQRLDSAGNILWPAGGVAISLAAGNQKGPKNCSDENNGMFVVWEDERVSANERDIYMHKVNAQGNISPASVAIDKLFISSVYPNPFRNQFSVMDDNIASLRLVNSLGQNVGIVITIKNDIAIVNIPNNLPYGAYFLQVIKADGTSYSSQILGGQ